ncbi:protein asteroid [Musca vetustissima]|uniref:protein asteroid n=1 Tax=Musca vetustissima TaxID=27455 RepID=UPI002AB6137E|nr:protein asteroid [Musca vetustissima]
MGVRGLTGFIARNAEKYLTPYELHDTNLLIDGDNLACNLYKDATGINSAFGGDYDNFYRAVVNFFVVLAECNIKPYVLMDGGYEQRKLRTVGKRMRGKISVIKRINPNASITVFPLMMKEVFVDAVRDCNVPVMRCVFEADDELAALGRKLNCPVLSYDSDFYIHNVRYIPLITLTVKTHTKTYKEKEDEDGDSERKLRKTEAKKLDKRTRNNRVMDTIVVDNKERKQRKGKSYKYLDCCMYRVENLIARGSLSKEKLPLFAALLGNDYISRSAFKNFYMSGMVKIGRGRKPNHQQRRIRLILKWLKDETSESAMNKIMSRLQKNQRQSLMAQVEAAISGYSNEQCRSYDFFKNHYEHVFEDFMEGNEDDVEDSEDDSNYELEEEDDEDYTEEEEEENDNEETTAIVDNEEEVSEIVEATEEKSENSEESSESDDDGEENGEQDDTNDIISKFPQWFLDKLYPANLPRFFVDLMHLRKYINNPQIEHYPYNDCNEIAVPILTLIYSLLNNVKGEEFEERVNEDGSIRHLFYTYLTRATRVTNIQYVHVEIKEKPKYEFVPENPNPLLFQTVFEQKMPELQSAVLFQEIEKLPEDLRLYFLAIVYWMHKSQHCDLIHLHALIVCLVVLRTIDSKIPPERDIKTFNKRFGKILKKERQVRDKEAAEGIKRTIRDDLKTLPIPERIQFIPKSDCYLVQNELLKHFHMQELFKKKYDLFSSTVLHAFAELQSVVFQLHSLSALLAFPYQAPQMCQLYCGTFLYNLYDLFRNRLDIEYYIRNFIFKDSQMMFDFYKFLWQWCEQFIPTWKRTAEQQSTKSVNKKIAKKKRQLERKKAAQEVAETVDPYADMLSSTGEGEDEFIDLNNKFCTMLKVS